MEIEYNDVTLHLTEIVECTRENIYDPSGTDLLFTRWRIGVVCTLASGGDPQATATNYSTRGLWNSISDLIGANPNASRQPPFIKGVPITPADYPVIQQPVTPAGNIFNPAFMTDAELRMRLMMPRKQLRITAWHPDGGKYNWLESPRPWVPLNDPVGADAGPGGTQELGPRVDADNGPKPLRCDVIQPSGEGGAMGIYFLIETAVIPVDPRAERLILSHRWETTHSHDDDYYLTRTTVGEVRFNPQIFNAGKVQPDWLRYQFFHPIPLGFRRGGPVLRHSKDGLTIQYEIHDTDPTVVFDPGDSGATSMSIVETVAMDNRALLGGHIVNMLKGFNNPPAPRAAEAVQGAFRR